MKYHIVIFNKLPVLLVAWEHKYAQQVCVYDWGSKHTLFLKMETSAWSKPYQVNMLLLLLLWLLGATTHLCIAELELPTL